MNANDHCGGPSLISVPVKPAAAEQHLATAIAGMDVPRGNENHATNLLADEVLRVEAERLAEAAGAR